MSIWQSNGPMRPRKGLWHRFHVWRAKRIYRRIVTMEGEALALKAKADALMRKHAEPPQLRLDLGDD